MDDISKLSTLLDDLEVQELIFGLAHVKVAAGSGASRLHAVVLRLAETTNPGQYDGRSLRLPDVLTPKPGVRFR